MVKESFSFGSVSGRITTVMLKKIAAYLPTKWQNELRRVHYAGQIRKNTFVTDEPEYGMLTEILKPGDWVIDIGANVGHYTKKFSEIVGEKGRVIAFEPVPGTFALLSANVQKFKESNVSLMNAALSEKLGVANISVPKFSTGLENFYRAHISNSSDGCIEVVTFSLDCFNFPERVALVKIDVEGHEESVLNGMSNLIENSRPVLIVETGSDHIIKKLLDLEYNYERLPGSPNLLFRPL